MDVHPPETVQIKPSRIDHDPAKLQKSVQTRQFDALLILAAVHFTLRKWRLQV
jgi:hypothetical protein